MIGSEDDVRVEAERRIAAYHQRQQPSQGTTILTTDWARLREEAVDRYLERFGYPELTDALRLEAFERAQREYDGRRLYRIGQSTLRALETGRQTMGRTHKDRDDVSRAVLAMYKKFDAEYPEALESAKILLIRMALGRSNGEGQGHMPASSTIYRHLKRGRELEAEPQPPEASKID